MTPPDAPLTTADTSQRPTAARVDGPPMLTAALALAEIAGVRIALGHWVLPTGRCSCGKPDCGSPGKHPWGDDWPARASSDANEIRAALERQPLCNIGIATGRASGVVVLDVDGDIGEQTLAQYPPLPIAPEVRTARGRHIYFAAPDIALRNRAGSRGRGLGPGLDLRAEGGFIVVPPSRHKSGFVYQWSDGRVLGVIAAPSTPEWIIERAADRPPLAKAEASSTNGSASRNDRWARAALEREVALVASATVGSRNVQLNESGFNLGMIVASGLLRYDEVHAALLSAALRCEMPEAEALKTIRSSVEAGMKRDTRSGPTRELAKSRASSGTSSSVSSASSVTAAEPVPKYSYLSDAIERQLRPLGPRLSTSIETLDSALRGGLPMGHLVVVQGPPGVGKTGLAAQWMRLWSSQNVACVWLAADQIASSVITRLGQLQGYVREDLESEGANGETARKSFAASCIGVPIVIIDPTGGESSARTLEDVGRVARDVAANRKCVLFIDSLQSARCAAAANIEAIRERIDCKLDVLLDIARRDGMLVVATSEVSRASYRGNDRSQNIVALAASKESGSIEYDLDVLVSLTSVKGEAGLVDVELPKNRLGTTPDFRLQQDSARASFAEVALPDADARSRAKSDAKSAKSDANRKAALKRVRDAVLGNLKLKSQRAVLDVCDGSQNDNAAAVRTMEANGVLVKENGFYRLRGPTQEASRGVD